MAIAICQGAAQIALLEDRVAEQDGKIDTLQCLHEGLRREIMLRHPSFPLPNPPANASSLLLDQSGPPTMSPAESALPPLIDLTMEGIAPTTTTTTVPDASAIDGLLFDYNQVAHPEDPDASGEIVDPGDLSNLVPEYNSSDDMDVEVEVKVEEASEEYRDPTPEIRYLVLGDSCWVLGVGTRFETRIKKLETRINLSTDTQHPTPKYRVPNLGCRYSGVGCRFQISNVHTNQPNLGCRYSGVGCRVLVLDSKLNTRTHESPSTEYQISGVGTRVSGVGCRVLGVGTQLKTRTHESLSTKYRISGVSTRYSGVRCWVSGVGCWVLGVGCWVSGVGCRVLGVGCWVSGVSTRFETRNSYKSEFSRYYVRTSSSYLPKIYMAVHEDGKGRENTASNKTRIVESITDEAGELNGMMYRDSKSRSCVKFPTSAHLSI
ncbi:uncharacterized protein EDB91DRAFT_1083581 [Suillus paluster]|uniref:uncharacterized protein n=1 Tax=Suillus paluster TaxID=48578 RepID=UPI001B862A4A|nr:uncharacterized protein EDB91DRAFT_1083581 [Suillus paluster]KAG1735662.1 hypothetical protein EDB91DRAFT_1083581 [Suillus paluster]